jgi:O-antigen ligase
MPFILGMGFMGSERTHRDILLVIVVAGLAYTIPILMEVAKGPFLQARLYGIDPGGLYQQQVRSGGGFRAPVFMGHGLTVSYFIGLCALSGVGLWRLRSRLWGAPMVIWVCVLFGVLILNKSVGAIISVILIAPLLMSLSARRFLTLTFALGLVLVTYPTLRAAGFIPVDSIRTVASSFSKDRADSLDFRLRNEDILLDRANQRPLFGWGGYNRNRVFVVTSWDSTKDVTITDGTWIIILGTSGWLGYLSLFGLLCYPFWHVFRRRKMGISPATLALVGMLLFNVLDLIPNSSLLPVTWLIAGALAGFTAMRSPQQRPRHLVDVPGGQSEGAAIPA